MPRGRPTAAEANKTRRRKRNSTEDGARMNLSVEEAMLDRDQYEYRWVSDRGSRLHALTERDDWDIVRQESGEVKDDGSDMGAAVSIVSGAKKNGEPERQYLCRKPKRWAEEDRAEKEARRAEVEEQMRRFAANGTDAARDEAFRTPDTTGANHIGRARA